MPKTNPTIAPLYGGHTKTTQTVEASDHHTIRDRSAKQPTFGPVEQPPLKIVSRSTQTRASNAARAALVVANVTPTGYRVGLFMANHARYATLSDIRRNVSPGEIFGYWPQAKIAAAMGCSERQVQRGVRSLREAGALEVRRRVRPCEASYVWVQPVGSDVGSDGPCVGSGVESDGPCVGSDVGSGVGSGVGSHTEPRTEPQKNHVGSSRAREPRQTCPDCGRSWPAEFGPDCHQCGDQPQTRSTTPDTTPSCYRRVRNCPQCHTLERGHNDTCQHCDWTRAAWDARGAT